MTLQGQIPLRLPALVREVRFRNKRFITQSNSQRFTFDGGAGTYLGTAILRQLLTVLTLGICNFSSFSFATRSFAPSELWTGGEASVALVGIASAAAAGSFE